MSELSRQLAALIETADTNVGAEYGQHTCGDSTLQILTSILEQAKADHPGNRPLQTLKLEHGKSPRWSDVLAIARFVQASLPLSS